MGNSSYNKVGVEILNRSKKDEEVDFSSYELTEIPKISSENIVLKLKLSINCLKNHCFENFKLDTLEELNLSQNNLQSSKYITSKSFPKLKILNLSSNQITILDENELSTFTSLLSLDLSNNQIKQLPSDLPSLIELKTLKISNNLIESDLIISKLPKLYSLDICNNIKLKQISKEVKNKVTYLDSDHPDLIIEGLYLGNVDSALNENLLKELEVTHVLSICKELTKEMVKEISERFNHLWIQADDADSEDLLYEQCYNFIHQARENNGKVLIHCWMGISRSSSITIMYMMKHKRMKFLDAYQLVKRQRPQISPNYGFIQSLKQFEKTLDI